MDTTLKVGSSANIQNCNTLRDEIVARLDQYGSVNIDISELCNADLCFAQLAYATVSYVSASGKAATFHSASHEYLSSVLVRAGLSPSLLAGAHEPCLEEGLLP